MKTVKAAIFMLILSGCDQRHPMRSYKCTDEQWRQVEKQTVFCAENTSFKSSFCLQSSKETLCDFIHPYIREGQDD